MRNKILCFIVAALAIVADLLTKHYAVVELKEKNQVIDVLPVLRWMYAENHGAAFSFLSDVGGWQRWFFLGVGAFATVVLTTLIIKSERDKLFEPLAYALILGGALGNVYDRATLGYVRDMISFYIAELNFYFAIFNVADVAISIGVGMLFLDFFHSLWRDKKQSR